MPDQMKVYSYVARTRDGEVLADNIRATSAEKVEQHLHNAGVVPYEIRELSGLNRNLSFGKKRIKQRDIGVFFRQMAVMLQAGVPIDRSLANLVEQTETSNPTFAAVIKSIHSDVEQGQTFPNALKKYPQEFSPLIIAMSEAGTISGDFAGTLGQIADNIDSSVKLRGKIRSAMTYPVFIFILAILIVAFMLLFIVPVFANLFQSLGGQLPLPTRILVGASNVLKFGGPVIIAGIIAFAFWWRKNKNKESVRRVVDPLYLRVPIFGRLVRLLSVARFSRNFASLLGAGIDLPTVLSLVGRTSGSVVIEDAVEEIHAKVMMGQAIAPQLPDYPIFPPMMIGMLRVGEEAGNIPDMMLRIADNYDDEVDRMTEALSSLIEPVMLVFLGGVVGAIVISLYLPIFSIYSQINQSSNK